MAWGHRPDRCDGTFESFCDKGREYDNLAQTIGQAEPGLLEYMSTYWKDWRGNDERFWKHEWNKHGTCISTLRPDCYNGYNEREEMVDYFRKTIDLFRGLDTYKVRLSFFQLLHHRFPSFDPPLHQAGTLLTEGIGLSV